MRECLLEDLLYIPFKTDFRDFIVLFREKKQVLRVLLNRATIHSHPRPGINSQPALTTSHIFATTTHDNPRPAFISPLSRYSIFCIFNRPIIYQISNQLLDINKGNNFQECFEQYRELGLRSRSFSIQQPA